jgi:outer membrane protein insertion porin family
MRRWLAFILSSILLAAPGNAAFGIAAQGSQKKRAASTPNSAAAPPSTKHSLESLKIEGNRRISVDKIGAAIGLKIGQMVEREDFDAARTRLLSTGAFESVGFEFLPSKSGTGFDGSFEVVEVAQMFAFQFEDLPASDEVLKAAISREAPIFDAEIPATRPVLGRCERAVMQALDGKVTVEAHMVATLHGGEPKIVFRPPGDRPRISEVRFSGNEVIPTSKLAMTFAEAAIGTEFKDAPVRTLLDKSIRPLYEARGRIRVAFTKVAAEKSAEAGVDAVAVTVTIDEGQEFKLGQIHYAGGQSRDLDKLAGLRAGELADFDEVKKAQDRIVQKFRGTGYLHAAVKQDRTVHDEERTVDLTLTVEPGPRFAFGKLIVEGLDLIGEPAVRKMWGEREGQPFDPNFPDAFLKDIRDDGIFDNLGKTSSSTKVNEETKIVDVTLTFEGMKGNAGRERRLKQPF